MRANKKEAYVVSVRDAKRVLSNRDQYHYVKYFVIARTSIPIEKFKLGIYEGREALFINKCVNCEVTHETKLFKTETDGNSESKIPYCASCEVTRYTHVDLEEIYRRETNDDFI